jgi:hypothetical protein
MSTFSRSSSSLSHSSRRHSRGWVLAGSIALLVVVGLGVWRWASLTGKPGVLPALFPDKASSAYSEYQSKQYIRRSSDLLDITIPESATVAEVVDLVSLRSQTPSIADVYDGVENGDYLILFDNQMVIYRPRANQVIYHGPDPKKIVENAEVTVQGVVNFQVKNKNALLINPEEMPEVRQIVDLEGVKLTDPKFFKDAKLGDVVAIFPENKIKVLFRLGLNEIINVQGI